MDAAPYFDDVADGPPGGRAVWLRTPDGVRIRAAHWPGADRGTVLILPGRTEYIEKYGPTAADMVAAGYHAVSLDVRGQGLADRPLPDRMKGHVRHFADFQRDLDALRPLIDSLPKPLFLIGHSMGGAIGLRALIEGWPVAAAAFSSPMWGIRFSPGLAPIATGLALVASSLGQGTGYAPSTGPQTYLMAAPFQDNTLTSDRATWDWMQRQLTLHPELALGGPTLHWLHVGLSEIRWLHRQPPPRVPTLVILGSHERIVNTDLVRRRMSGWREGRLVILPGAEHETLMEGPHLRGIAIAEILTHFAGATAAS